MGTWRIREGHFATYLYHHCFMLYHDSRTSQALTGHEWLHLGDGHGGAGGGCSSGLVGSGRIALRLDEAAHGADVQCVGGLNSGEVFLRQRNHLYPGGVRLLGCLCFKFLNGGKRDLTKAIYRDISCERHRGGDSSKSCGIKPLAKRDICAEGVTGRLTCAEYGFELVEYVEEFSITRCSGPTTI